MLKKFLACLLLGLLLSACNMPAATPVLQTPSPTAPAAQASTPTLLPTDTTAPLPTNTVTPLATQASTSTASPTPTIIPTQVPSDTPVPTYVVLRGEVTIAQAICHYGPGAPYLYKYGVYQGSNLEIIARAEPGAYIEVQAIGGTNPCWVNPQYMKIKGDLNSVQPIAPQDVRLPQSPYYGPLTGVSAQRSANDVTVAWHALQLRAGDDSLQVPYLVEAWVCQSGQIVFTPLGSYKTALKITDEPGCTAPSHARVYAAEKHGYTRAVEVPWPANPLPTPTP